MNFPEAALVINNERASYFALVKDTRSCFFQV